MYPPPRPTLPHHPRPSQAASQLQSQSQSSGHQAPPTTRPSTSATAASTSSTSGASPLLQARVAAKQKELADLRELRDLSGQLAAQMTMLEQKLGTLAGGTEAVALVLSNWHSVLSAISMASSKLPAAFGTGEAVGEQAESGGVEGDGRSLPETLVRIPVVGSEQQQQQQQGALETDDTTDSADFREAG